MHSGTVHTAGVQNIHILNSAQVLQLPMLLLQCCHATTTPLIWIWTFIMLMQLLPTMFLNFSITGQANYKPLRTPMFLLSPSMQDLLCDKAYISRHKVFLHRHRQLYWSTKQNKIFPADRSLRWDYKPRSCGYTHAKRSHTHIKDSVVHVRVWWIMETLKHPACPADCVVWLFHHSLSQGKTTWIFHGRNPKRKAEN